MFFCQFCERGANTKNSNVQHELYCKVNPLRKIRKSSMGMLGKTVSNGYTVKNQWSDPLYAISESTKEKMSNAAKEQRWSEDRKSRHSIAMKSAVENNPDSYTSSNRGRTKQVVYNGVKLQGKWELDFYIWCEQHQIECIRCTESFDYVWNGNRKYFPDFYLPLIDSYVEVKGYKTERDIAKWEQFPKKLLIVQEQEMRDIRNGKYTLPSI